MKKFRQAVVTIKKSDGRIKRVLLPVYLNYAVSDMSVADLAIRLAEAKAGAGTILDIEWMGEEEL